MSDEEERQPLLKERQKFALEVLSFLYFIARFATLPLIQQYVYFLVEKKHNFTRQSYISANNYLDEIEINDSSHYTYLSLNDSGIHYNDYKVAVEGLNLEASMLVLYLTLAECLPSAISIIIFGFCSDVIGKRKFLMWLPCFGNCLYMLGFILPHYITDANIDNPVTMIFFYIASIVSGLFGSTPGYLSGCASYISDVDSPERRTERLAIIELVIGICFGFSALINGFWISYSDNFEIPMFIILSLSFVAGFGIVCFLSEPYPKFYQIHESFVCKVTEVIAQGKKMFTTLKLGLETYLIFGAFLFYVFVQPGQERLYVLFFINHPLSWNPVEIGLFLFLLYVIAGLGSWPMIKLLKKWLTDVDIFMLSLVSMFFGTLLMLVTRNIYLIYFSSIVKCLHLMPYAVARSLISLKVEKEDQGSIYAIVHSLLGIATFLGPMFHIWIFTETLKVFNGFSFVVSAILIVPAFSLVLFVKYNDKEKKVYDDMGSVVYDPQLKDEDEANRLHAI